VASLSDHHRTLVNGVGKCSVPMFAGFGAPAGFCDRDAYGERPDCPSIRYPDGGERRLDGKFTGYVPALACPRHGGPCDPVKFFQDGTDADGAPMWCAVRHDFTNLQESPAGFSICRDTALVNLELAEATS
jgi:hypothetical protein